MCIKNLLRKTPSNIAHAGGLSVRFYLNRSESDFGMFAFWGGRSESAPRRRVRRNN